MHKPTFRQLQIFSAVAKHKSFTRAAEELFLTQSSVSTQLKQLTEIIGHPLWEQIGKKINLTPIGERIFHLCNDFENIWQGFEYDMAVLNEPTKGNIVVSCVNTCQYFFPRLLGYFRQAYPEINVSFKVFNRQQVIERLSNNMDDLYIMDYLSADLDIKVVPFVDNPLVMLSHPAHALAQQKNISLDALEGELLLVREPGSGTRRETDRFFESYKVNIKSNMEMGSNEAIKQGIIGGLGIGVLSLYAAALELRLGILSMLDVHGFPIMRKWNIAYPNGKVINPVVRTFLDFLKTDGRIIAGSALENAQLSKTVETAKNFIEQKAATPAI